MGFGGLQTGPSGGLHRTCRGSCFDYSSLALQPVGPSGYGTHDKTLREHRASAKHYVGVCQNDAPFCGGLNIRFRIIIGIQKETRILATTHVPKRPWHVCSIRQASAKTVCDGTCIIEDGAVLSFACRSDQISAGNAMAVRQCLMYQVCRRAAPPMKWHHAQLPSYLFNLFVEGNARGGSAD